MNVFTRNREATRRADLLHERAAALVPENGPAPESGHIGHRLSAMVIRTIAITVVAAMVAISLGWWWWNEHIGFREDTVIPTFSVAEQDLYADWARRNAQTTVDGVGAAPIVLTYHDISPDDHTGEYVLTPEAFAAQMKMLHDSGYRTLTSTQYAEYLQGAFTPPAQSVVITFDDGTAGLYKYADSILEHYGFSAISFLITSSVGTRAPYYLTWQQVGRMAGSGRWSFESHTDDLHHRIDTDTGPTPAMATRVVTDGHTETDTEFRDRITADIDQVDKQFAAHDLPAPVLFSFPFSSPTSRITDPQLDTSTQLLNARYVATFTNQRNAVPPAPRGTNQNPIFERLEVKKGESTRAVFERIAAAQTLPVHTLDPVDTDSSWLEPGRTIRAPIHDDELPFGIVRFDADTLTHSEALWAAQRTDQWTDYVLTGTAIDLRAGNSVGLRVRAGSGTDQSVVLSVSRTLARVTQGRQTVAEHVLSDADTHDVRITVSETTTAISVDGVAVATVRSDDGRGAFSVIGDRRSPRTEFSAWADLQIGSL